MKNVSILNNYDVAKGSSEGGGGEGGCGEGGGGEQHSNKKWPKTSAMKIK